MSPIILEAHDLTKKYRHTVALDHIDLQIEKGKIYGFIGQNGAGKTTFLRLVTGLAFPTSGTLGLWGKSSAKDLQEHIVSPETQTIAIAHCDCESDATYLADKIRSLVNVKDIIIRYYDLCTGAHVGPGTVALFYMGDHR